MEIQSAFNSGVQGFQKASSDVTQAASDIARETARPATSTETATEPAQAAAAQTTPSVTDSLVTLKVAENNAAASARVIDTADKTLGTIIDTRV